MKTTDELCEIAYDTYETAAAAHSVDTQERSRVPWADLPDEDKAAMRAMMVVISDVIITDFRKDLVDWQ